MNKKIFTLLLLVFVLISMSAVSSADLNGTDSALAVSDSSNIVAAPANNNSDVLGINENQDTLKVPDSGDDILGVGSQFVSFECPSSMDEGNTSKMVTFTLYNSDHMEINGGTVWLNCDRVNILSTTTDQDGKGSFSLASLTSGTHSLKCVYNGDSQYSPCESATKNITVGGVTPSKTTVYLQNVNGVTSIEMNESEDETFTAAVYADSMGANPMAGLNLKLTAGPNTLNAVSNGNGKATFDLSTVTPGTFTASIGVDSDTYEEDTPLTFALTVIGQKTSVVLVLLFRMIIMMLFLVLMLS